MISAEVAPVDSAEMLISDTSVEDACDAATIPTACNAETGVNGHCHRVDSEDELPALQAESVKQEQASPSDSDDETTAFPTSYKAKTGFNKARRRVIFEDELPVPSEDPVKQEPVSLPGAADSTTLPTACAAKTESNGNRRMVHFEDELPSLAADSIKQELVTLPDAAELERCIRTFVTSKTVYEFTRKTARERLERELKLPPDSLLPHRDVVNGIVNNLVDEFETMLDASLPVARQEDEGETSETRASTSSTGASHFDRTSFVGTDVEQPQPKRRGTKRSLETLGDDSVSVGKENASLSDESSSEDEEERSSGAKRRRSVTALPKRGKSTVSKHGVKSAQANLMTKASFTHNATPLKLCLGQLEFNVEPRVFSTGSCGWYCGTKVPLLIGDKEATCLLNVNCTVVGSKQWSEGKKKSSKKSE